MAASLKSKDRALEIIKRLASTYPDAHCELDSANPLQLLVATILSAQCTDKRVNMVTPALFLRCPKAADYVEIPQEELETLIKSTGFYRAKAKSIKGCATGLVTHHGGEVPQTMEALIQLPGVGRKTANVVLGNAFNLNEGIVVDTHVQRLSQRLALTKEETPEKIEQSLMKWVPKPDWCNLSHWLIFHGRRRCMARKPDCSHCELADICPREGV